MEFNMFLKSISIISAVLAIVSFCTLVLMAILMYPGPFSPVTNYISDLGSSKHNPHGSAVFNAACAIAGTFTIMFFAGLNQWRIQGQRKLTIARLIGMFSGLMLILVGVFSEDYGRHHTIVSGIFFISLIISIIYTDFALRKHSEFIRLIEYYGVVACLISLIYLFSYLLGQVIIIAEWISVIGALVWMGLIAYNMLRIPGNGADAVKKE